MRTFIYAFLLSATVFFASCTLPSMIKMAKEQGLTAEPNPLEAHNGVVTFKLTANLPVKMLKKGTVYTLKPYYKYDGDKEIALDPVAFKAEDYPSSDTQQPSVSKSFSFPYQPPHKQGMLEIEGEAAKGEKTLTTPRLPVAPGVITTSMLVQNVDFVAYAPHGYNDQEELVPLVIPDFSFEQGRSVLRRSETRKPQGKELEAFIASKNTTRKVTIIGTHSPEGTETANERLAQERAAAIEAYYRKKMDQYDYEGLADSISFTLSPVVREWTGFEQALDKYEGISEEEKIAYNEIIANGQPFEAQEKEMQSLPSYKKIFEDIYPDLRAAKTQIMKVKEKKSPAEIASLARKVAAGEISADTLSFEELMYAAAKNPSQEEKEKIYMSATKKGSYASAHNNLGAIYLAQAIAADPSSREEALKKAEAQFELAAKIDKDSPEANSNLAVMALMEGDAEKGFEHVEKGLAKATGDLAKEMYGIKGAAQIHLAKYSEAISSESMASPTAVNLFNKGLAELLTGSYENASASLEKAVETKKDFAVAYYVSAVVAARTDNQEEVLSNLRQAVSIDPDLKQDALTDLEFSKWATAEAFTSLMK